MLVGRAVVGLLRGLDAVLVIELEIGSGEGFGRAFLESPDLVGEDGGVEGGHDREQEKQGLSVLSRVFY